jgi:hypothetical protein
MSETPRVVPREFADYSVALLDLIDSWFFGEGAEIHAEAEILTPASINAPTPGEGIVLPAAQAYVYGGDGDQLQIEPVADVAFFAADYNVASLLARRFAARFVGYSHRVSSNGRSVLFDSVSVVTLPAEVPWVDDDSVRRFMATYSFSIRR